MPIFVLDKIDINLQALHVKMHKCIPLDSRLESCLSPQSGKLRVLQNEWLVICQLSFVKKKKRSEKPSLVNSAAPVNCRHRPGPFPPRLCEQTALRWGNASMVIFHRFLISAIFVKSFARTTRHNCNIELRFYNACTWVMRAALSCVEFLSVALIL